MTIKSDLEKALQDLKYNGPEAMFVEPPRTIPMLQTQNYLVTVEPKDGWVIPEGGERGVMVRNMPNIEAATQKAINIFRRKGYGVKVISAKVCL